MEPTLDIEHKNSSLREELNVVLERDEFMAGEPAEVNLFPATGSPSTTVLRLLLGSRSR